MPAPFRDIGAQQRPEQAPTVAADPKTIAIGAGRELRPVDIAQNSGGR
jgi:hypothetical protein